MKTIMIINKKGGVGKTITAVNLATCLADYGKEVLLIDLDDQGNATSNIFAYGEIPEDGDIADLFFDHKGIQDVVISTPIFNLSMITASERFQNAETKLIMDSLVPQQFHLKTALEKIAKRNIYDYVIIDCPPHLNTVTANAMMAADYAIIPAQASEFSMEGVPATISCLERAAATPMSNGVQLLGVLITRMDERLNISKQALEQLAQSNWPVFKTHIRQCVRVPESEWQPAPVVHYDPRCTATLDYWEFAKEFLGMMGDTITGRRDYGDEYHDERLRNDYAKL